MSAVMFYTSVSQTRAEQCAKCILEIIWKPMHSSLLSACVDVPWSRGTKGRTTSHFAATLAECWTKSRASCGWSETQSERSWFMKRLVNKVKQNSFASHEQSSESLWLSHTQTHTHKLKKKNHECFVVFRFSQVRDPCWQWLVWHDITKLNLWLWNCYLLVFHLKIDFMFRTFDYISPLRSNSELCLFFFFLNLVISLLHSWKGEIFESSCVI